MKNFYAFTFCLLVLATSCTSNKTEKTLPRIAIAGLAIESSTFSPALTHEAAFKARVDTAVFSSYPFLAKDSAFRHTRFQAAPLLAKPTNLLLTKPWKD